MLNVRTLADLQSAIVSNLHRLDRNAFDVVVGVPRSGMIPASIIATLWQKPLADVRGYAAGIVNGASGTVAQPGRRVLLVDDTVNKGGAMARAVAQMPKGTKITRCCVFGPYQVPDPARIVDISFAECRGPRVFAWNLLKHKRLGNWGFDFDGVLCRDNTKAENDDGARYLDFITNAEPLFLPKRPIGHVVTCRLEKYRNETEDWLARHGVQVGRIHMMQLATKAERMAHGNRGGWKAGIVKQLGLEMFVESSPKQASIIAREAGVPVFCTETQSLA
jgi:uncharacterized HAD superfamily protein